MKIVELQEVSKEFPGKLALNRVSLSVEQGEIVAIIGPNGSGKTTLLRLIDLIDTPTNGKVVVMGVDASASEKARLKLRRRVALVFQKTFVFNASVYENVEYALRVRGMDRDEIEARAERALETTSLMSYRNRKATTLSGGEAQRLALARAIAYGPELLLLDEPTASLDPQNTGLVEEVIRNVQSSTITTVVLVTHSVHQARRLAHRVAFLLNGQLVEVNDTATIFTRPLDPRTSAFLKGEMIY